MACFIVPAAEAVVATAVTKITENKEQKKSTQFPSETTPRGSAIDAAACGSEKEKPAFSRKLRWLDTMLWGGSALLLLEHIWHGEMTIFFPFFTAAATPDGLAEMLTEMRTVGVTMAALVTLVWAGMVIVSSVFEKRPGPVQKKTSPAGHSLRILGLIYGGSLLMGLTDAFFSLREMGAYAFFHPTTQVLISNAALALCTLALGVVICLAVTWIQDRQIIQAR